MGSRADFYKGRGKDAIWLGSIAWDGYPEGIPEGILKASDEKGFDDALKDFSGKRNDYTAPGDGWPWPWETSHTTDFSYAFDDGKVWAACFGTGWAPGPDAHVADWDALSTAEFPVMKTDKSAPAGSNKSGIMVVGVTSSTN